MEIDIEQLRKTNKPVMFQGTSNKVHQEAIREYFRSKGHETLYCACDCSEYYYFIDESDKFNALHITRHGKMLRNYFELIEFKIPKEQIQWIPEKHLPVVVFLDGEWKVKIIEEIFSAVFGGFNTYTTEEKIVDITLEGVKYFGKEYHFKLGAQSWKNMIMPWNSRTKTYVGTSNEPDEEWIVLNVL